MIEFEAMMRPIRADDDDAAGHMHDSRIPCIYIYMIEARCKLSSELETRARDRGSSSLMILQSRGSDLLSRGSEPERGRGPAGRRC